MNLTGQPTHKACHENKRWRSYSLTDVQFVNCGIGLQAMFANFHAGNILMHRVGAGFSGIIYDCVAEHLTFDRGDLVADDPWHYDDVCSLDLTNSILTGIHANADADYLIISTNAVINLESSDGVYQTAANANYYLAPGSPYRNMGTTAIDPNLWAGLQTMTTYAPQDGGYLDASAPDYGYHYSVNEDSDYDGIPDWWEWHWFGAYAYNAATLDNGGVNTLLYDYTNNIAPAVFTFTGLEVTNNYIRSSPVPAQLDATGYPYYIAVSVDDTNFMNDYLNDAAWNLYAGTNGLFTDCSG